jgi:hypothetical protein
MSPEILLVAEADETISAAITAPSKAAPNRMVPLRAAAPTILLREYLAAAKHFKH